MDQANKLKDCYLTKDLYEAAYIYAIGKKLLGLSPEGSHYRFVFSGRVACEKASSNYWQGKGLVKAKAMADALRTLKDLIFSRQ